MTALNLEMNIIFISLGSLKNSDKEVYQLHLLFMSFLSSLLRSLPALLKMRSDNGDLSFKDSFVELVIASVFRIVKSPDL